MRGRNTWWWWYLSRIAIIVVIGVPSVLLIEKWVEMRRGEIREDNKTNCVGRFDTIPCHQYKIEKLLLESRQKELLK
jgi:hypothetical protein